MNADDTYLLDDGRMIERHLEPGECICLSCGDVFWHTPGIDRHACSPTEIGMTVAQALDFYKAIDHHDRQIKLAMGVQPVPARAEDECADCHLATLPGFPRCFYCEQLAWLKAASLLRACNEQVATPPVRHGPLRTFWRDMVAGWVAAWQALKWMVS
jgi:hypothetical protein